MGYKVLGGGGAGGSAPTVDWGPDFGESSDGNTFKVKPTLTMPSLALENQKTINAALTMPELALSNSKSLGVHLAGTALGAPFWQGVETDTETGTAVASITVPIPSGIQVGDLMLAHVSQRVAAGIPGSILAPAGWNSVRSQQKDVMHSQVFSKVYALSDGTSATFTENSVIDITHMIGEIHWINANAASPINVSAVATLDASALDPDPDSPSVTTTAINTLVFAFLTHDHAALSFPHSAPVGHVERADFEVTFAATVLAHHTMTRVFAATGATGTVEHNCEEVTATNAIMTRVAVAPGTITLAS